VAFFWWGEFFSLAGYIGSGLILAAVILMVSERSGGEPVNGEREP
jgi:drug/metabolite transporter (DMT)-like permease